MLCYVCEKEFPAPIGVISIVTCPHCKHNIITDGKESEEITRLNNQITKLKAEITTLEIIIKDYTASYEEDSIGLETKNILIKKLMAENSFLSNELNRRNKQWLNIDGFELDMEHKLPN